LKSITAKDAKDAKGNQDHQLRKWQSASAGSTSCFPHFHGLVLVNAMSLFFLRVLGVLRGEAFEESNGIR
jgi:hypothetical protein